MMAGLELLKAETASLLALLVPDESEISEKVRGANYLTDKKKIPAQEPVFSLAATDLLQVEEPTFNIARFLPSLRSAQYCPASSVTSEP